MSRKTKRNEQRSVDIAPEEVGPSKSMMMLYRITVTVLGIVAITIICAILFNKWFPDNRSVWPALGTLGCWAAWIVYVFKFMKLKKKSK